MNESTTIPLTEKQQRTGMRLAHLGQGTGAILPQLLIQSVFGVLLIKHLGGSDFQAMLPGSLLLLPRILQIPTSHHSSCVYRRYPAYAVRGYKNRRLKSPIVEVG